MKPILKSRAHRALASAPKWCFLCLALLLGIAAQSSRAQVPPNVDATLKRMLAATESPSRNAFVADGDASFQTDITPAMFNSFSAEFAPRLKRGYTTTFVTQLRQDGYAVYVWKIEFKDGGDDLLFTLAIKDGKVGGFFVH